MNRRKAIGGILGITGVSLVSFAGAKYFIGNSSHKRGNLETHIDLISELADVIIPPTSSPGGKATGVQDYIIGYLENCSSLKEYNNFINGLNDLQETSVNSYNRVFEECSANQKQQLLENLDNQWNSKGIFLKISNKLLGKSFFNILKTLTVEGYCTSSMGATKHLIYRPIPGRYNAVTDIGVKQKAWATK